MLQTWVGCFDWFGGVIFFIFHLFFYLFSLSIVVYVLVLRFDLEMSDWPRNARNMGSVFRCDILAIFVRCYVTRLLNLLLLVLFCISSCSSSFSLWSYGVRPT